MFNAILSIYLLYSAVCIKMNIAYLNVTRNQMKNIYKLVIYKVLVRRTVFRDRLQGEPDTKEDTPQFEKCPLAT